MTRRFGRTAVAVALAGLALLGLATPALAHNQLVGSDPREGASMDTGPKQVTLTFDQPVQPGEFNRIAITGPKGGSWVDGTTRVDGNTVSTKVRPLGPAGKYTIGYYILSADGHPVSEQFTITLTTPGNGTPGPAPQQKSEPGGEQAPAEETGAPLWVWIAGAVVLLAIGLFVALRAGGSGGSGSSGGSGKDGKDAGGQ